MKIDQIRITVEGYRSETYHKLIQAALERGPIDFPKSIVRNLAENTHVEIISKQKITK